MYQTSFELLLNLWTVCFLCEMNKRDEKNYTKYQNDHYANVTKYFLKFFLTINLFDLVDKTIPYNYLKIKVVFRVFSSIILA